MAISKDEAQEILHANFAPWVLALDLTVESVQSDSASLRLPFSASLTRVGGSVCGQALMAAADTAMVIAISSFLGGFKPMATVGQTVSFMRPVIDKDVLLTARVIKGGKTLVFGDITLIAVSRRNAAIGGTTPNAETFAGTLVAHASTTYALAG